MAYPRWPTEQNLPPLASPPPHLTRRRRRWSEEENLPPPETPATLNVVIPHGCGPGDTIQVESPSGKSLDVVVPPGSYGGSTLVVEEPPAEPPQPPPTFEVVVPRHVYAGQAFPVQLGDGSKVIDVIVPDGCGPGSVLTVEDEQMMSDVPESPGLQASAAAMLPPPDWPRSARFLLGDRVELQRRHHGLYAVGTIKHAYEGIGGVLYQVLLDNGMYKNRVPEEEVYHEIGGSGGGSGIHGGIGGAGGGGGNGMMHETTQDDGYGLWGGGGGNSDNTNNNQRRISWGDNERLGGWATGGGSRGVSPPPPMANHSLTTPIWQSVSPSGGGSSGYLSNRERRRSREPW